jgi:hypothetical protein
MYDHGWELIQSLTQPPCHGKEGGCRHPNVFAVDELDLSSSYTRLALAYGVEELHLWLHGTRTPFFQVGIQFVP